MKSPPAKTYPWLKPIRIHTPNEGHRQASWLELFVDLGFVVAISSLTTLLEEGFSGSRLATYLVVFFAIFWLWNRFTWYSSYYDNDDVLYRLSYLLAVFPILGIVNNIDRIVQQDYSAATRWYIVLDALLVFLWSRTLRRAPKFKANARSFVFSYALGMVLMIASLFVPTPVKYVCWGAALLSEMIGPLIGWRQSEGKLPVHTGHIVERHGLFTIILLGEGVVSVSDNFQQIVGLTTGGWLLLAYLLVAALWWIYFDYGYGFATNLSKSTKNTFIFGYGQFLVFAAIALVTISLEFGLDHWLAESGQSAESELTFGRLLVGSLGTFLVALSLIQMLISHRNPPSIYGPRLAVGVGLVFTSVLLSSLLFATALVIGAGAVLIVGANDTYRWGQRERQRTD